MIKEAIVLDKTKRNIQFKQTPIIQCIGKSNFSILEIVSDENVKLQENISTDNKVVHRIHYDKLTTIAQKELEKAIESIINENPKRFINFFNNAKPIGLRRHQLDLLPMIGKKHRMAIIEHIEDKGPFNSFEDIKEISMLPDPIQIIINRIIEEIENYKEIKYHLFTIPYVKKKK